MNKQKVFNQVVIHLITQNERAFGPRGNCVYRGKDGLRCAIGCLIPDDKYNEDMEGTPLSKKQSVQDAISLKMSSLHLQLLVSLQFIHDHTTPHHWETELKAIAKQNKLSFPSRTLKGLVKA